MKVNTILLTLQSCMVVLLVSSIAGCSATYERRDPTGELFPAVTGTTLDDRSLSMPSEFAGQATLLLVGYKMESQFDIDRWLLGLQDAEIDVPTYELPTIPGLLPGLFAGMINDGMRSGIPEEEHAIVVTIYDDAKTVARFLGNDNPLPARVVLLDAQGRVAFFHDRGYSVRSLLKLADLLKELRAETTVSSIREGER